MASRSFELPSSRGPGKKGAPQKGGAPKKPFGPPREYSAERQEELLRDYIRLDPKYWSNLQVGNQIRYVGRDGLFKYGGVIQIVRFAGKSTTSAPREYMRLGAAVDPGKNWVVPWDSFAEIYILPPVAMIVMQDRLEAALKTLDANVIKIATVLKKVRSDMQALSARVAEPAALAERSVRK